MILTLTGASGAGKTTIAGELLKKLPICAQMVPSYTTRKPRETDLPGEYRYVSKFRFWFLKTTGAFLWTVYPHGNSYGTTKRWATRALRGDEVYIMLLFFTAIKELNNFAKKTGYSERIFSFYVHSPSQEILRERLKSRGDTEDEIERRLADCAEWDLISWVSDFPCEHVINDGTIESVTEEVITRFLKKLDDCSEYF